MAVFCCPIDPFQLVGMQLNWRTEQWVTLCMIIHLIAAWRFSFVLSSSSEVLTSHLKGFYWRVRRVAVWLVAGWRFGWLPVGGLVGCRLAVWLVGGFAGWILARSAGGEVVAAGSPGCAAHKAQEAATGCAGRRYKQPANKKPANPQTKNGQSGQPANKKQPTG